MRGCKKINFLFYFLFVLFVEFGLLLLTAIALLPAARAVAVRSWPRRAGTAEALLVHLFSSRWKSTRRGAETTAGTVIRRADDEEVGVALGTVTRPLTPVLRRGRTVGSLLAVSAQWLVAAVAGEVAVLRDVAAVSAGLWPIRRAVQIIIVIADVAAEIIVELAVTRVLIVRRVVRLAEL